MKSSHTPTKHAIPFGQNGNKRDIPPETKTGSGEASLSLGFPPETMVPKVSGGIPPSGKDFNGILNELSAMGRWANAGAGYPFDAAFANAIGGYPAGAKIPNSENNGFWLNTVDNNLDNPEVADGRLTGWVPAENHGIATLSGLAKPDVTLTALQAAKARIVLTGDLKANVAVIFPAWQKSWTVVNQCTGSGSLICRTKVGAGVVVPKGESREIIGDGSGLVQRIVNASTAVAGITRLSSATDSDSETMAATPKAVKAVMDLAASSAVKSVNGKKGEVQLTAGDVGALAQTGGTVNGPLTVEGAVNVTAPDYLVKSGAIYDKANNVRNTQGLRLQGEGAQGSDIFFWEQIGKSAAMKFHVWSGGRDGVFDFHNTGEFRANGGAQFGGNIHVSWGGRTATFHENGDVVGPIWGGALSAWLNNQLNGRTRTQVSGGRGGWWYKDELSGFIIQGGLVNRTDNTTRVNFPIGYQRECFGVQLTLSDWGYQSIGNIFAKPVDNSGFGAVMGAGEIQFYWTAVGV